MKQIMFLLCTAICAASCTHVYYAPNTANVPLLSQKGETLINGLYSEGSLSTFSGGEFQVATAISGHVGIMANTMFVSTTESRSYDEESGKGSYAEFAAGLFRSYDKKKKFLGEIYAGTGFGGVNNNYGEGQESKVNITKLFVQPAIGFKSKFFELAFTPKISFINWRVKNDNLIVDPNNAGYYFNEYDKENLNSIRRKPNFISFEPALILRGGFPNIKFHAGWSYSHSGSRIIDLTENFIGSTGISINFNTKKKVRMNRK